MKILYIARFGPHDNCDEDAIAHALRVLGHTVWQVHEKSIHCPPTGNYPADLTLFHKWDDVGTLRCLPRPRAFWYFDKVTSSGDPTMEARSATIKNWMARVLPEVDLGFCTDGDWVAEDCTGKLRWLPQGANERVVGKSECQRGDKIPILFTGKVANGQSRAAHVAALQARYGDDLRVVGAVGSSGRVHGRALAGLIASSEIVLAPDGPQTDRYWSNRVYLTCGFGGFMLHPRCAGLLPQYKWGSEVEYYRGPEQCFDLIDFWLKASASRRDVAEAGLQRTLREHLYRHRVERLIEEVRMLHG